MRLSPFLPAAAVVADSRSRGRSRRRSHRSKGSHSRTRNKDTDRASAHSSRTGRGGTAAQFAVERRGLRVVFGSDVAEGLRGAGGRDRDRGFNGEGQGCFGVDDRRVIAGQQDAGDSGDRSDSRADRGSRAISGSTADYRADAGGRGDRANLLAGGVVPPWRLTSCERSGNCVPSASVRWSARARGARAGRYGLFRPRRRGRRRSDSGSRPRCRRPPKAGRGSRRRCRRAGCGRRKGGCPRRTVIYVPGRTVISFGTP